MSREDSGSGITEHTRSAGLRIRNPDAGDPWRLPAYLLPVLEELAMGTPDATACRNLHMSARTFSRRVAALLDALGAKTRFQGGMAVVHRGILPADPRLVTRRGELIWDAGGPRDPARPPPSGALWAAGALAADLNPASHLRARSGSAHRGSSRIT
ncbi:hypothetical protein [Sphaerisporangium sp. TRM90804]|uniref:hypothetical protein n=1 Tax=Sphaerisporangium sp. TRM90804 TaxID=3031113 RepID=UPI00244C97CA|nr:hypothetical protein [Sphaerisporangium sp. TRM90804]MDH2428494.1 hypothetical protein [Sphaerisporangium sp. TRM90804]